MQTRRRDADSTAGVGEVGEAEIFCHRPDAVRSNFPRMSSRGNDSEFNTPEEMLVRFSFLLCLASFTSGVLATAAGAIAHDVRLLGLGLALLGVATGLRSWLSRKGRFASAETALQGVATPEAGATDAAKVAELVRLLREWEALERRRGGPGFDPWAVQAVRRDIRVMVEADPALEGLFHDPRRAA
jgi:hypothetical protein